MITKDLHKTIVESIIKPCPTPKDLGFSCTEYRIEKYKKLLHYIYDKHENTISLSTITIMFIMRTGSLLSVGYEKIILLYNDMTLETADVISSYVYRRGLIDADYSYSAAVGMFNSVINLIILCITNTICKRLNETSLW